MSLEVDWVALVVALSGLVTAVAGLVSAARSNRRTRRTDARLEELQLSLNPPPEIDDEHARPTPREPLSKGRIYYGPRRRKP